MFFLQTLNGHLCSVLKDLLVVIIDHSHNLEIRKSYSPAIAPEEKVNTIKSPVLCSQWNTLRPSHDWGCLSSKEIGSLADLHKTITLNEEWDQNIQEKLLPAIQEQFCDNTCIFQYDGAPCYKAKGIKWFRDYGIENL